jgi:phosphoserine phosphatase
MAQYRRMVETDPRTAYIEAARALEGFSLDYLIQITKRVLFSEADTIFCDGFEVPVPTPNLAMRAMINLLREWDYAIFVISASNDVSAKIAGSMLFGIPADNILGIKTRAVDGRLTGIVQRRVPVGEGKVAHYRVFSGDVLPMVVATDSEIDLPLLQMCDSDGVAILVGATDSFYAKAKQEFPLTVSVHRLPGHNTLFFQKHHRVA